MLIPGPHPVVAREEQTVDIPWPDGPLASLDLETTGRDPASDRVLELALLLERPGHPVEPLVDTLIDPGPEVVISPDASAVHGITRERLIAEAAPPAAQVLAEVRDTLARLADDGIGVVIFNATFDWPLLAADLARLDPPQTLPDCRLIDPLVLDRHVDRYRKGKRTLEAACGHYGIVLDDAHRAGADALASLGVARAVGRVSPPVAGLDLDALQTLQVGAYATWRDSFNDYLRRIDADRGPVTGDWPGTAG